MNLAFPALCILLLALPGVIFRKAFARAALPMPLGGSSGEHTVNKYPVSIRPITEEVSISLVWTLLLHVFWLSLWSLPGLAHFKPDIGQLATVLHGPEGLGSVAYQTAFTGLVGGRVSLVWYFVSLYVFSFILGRGLLWMIRYWKLDHEWMVVRLEDQWFYLLRGEIFRFREFKRFLPKNVPPISGTYISVVVAQSGTDYLYKGFLWDFHLDRDGNLDRLVLHHAIRSEFSPAEKKATRDRNGADTEKEGSVTALPARVKAEADKLRISEAEWKFQRVSSQLFTLRYADCKTLACTYFYVRRPQGRPVAAKPVSTAV